MRIIIKISKKMQSSQRKHRSEKQRNITLNNTEDFD